MAENDVAAARVRDPNATHLRHAIDSGETGDKVPFPDIATSPLGTDAEAGGNAPATAEVALSIAQEARGRPRDVDAQASAKTGLPGVSVGPTVPRPGPQHVPWLIAAGALLLTLLVWLALSRLNLLP